jgi:heterodisulfide reductase subunit B
VEAEYLALNVPERYEWIKKYHAKRIAFHVVIGWHERIVLNEDKKTIKDGLHRLKAAIFLGCDTVEIEET